MKGNLLKKVISCVLGATMVTSMFVTGFSFASAEVGYINLDRTNFKITVPSAYGSNPSTYMLDGNKSTIWKQTGVREALSFLLKYLWIWARLRRTYPELFILQDRQT